LAYRLTESIPQKSVNTGSFTYRTTSEQTIELHSNHTKVQYARKDFNLAFLFFKVERLRKRIHPHRLRERWLPLVAAKANGSSGRHQEIDPSASKERWPHRLGSFSRPIGSNQTGSFLADMEQFFP
jgi:TPP-dependent 2-oxoacid decarboxylase